MSDWTYVPGTSTMIDLSTGLKRIIVDLVVQEDPYEFAHALLEAAEAVDQPSLGWDWDDNEGVICRMDGVTAATEEELVQAKQYKDNVDKNARERDLNELRRLKEKYPDET